ncbi:MAG: aminotransferase [marine bacterium B5-7]|nr:MAG: aminotransferase [marine bacterium B5-7]
MRDDFDIPEDVTYLNCAYISPLARTVAEAGITGVRRKSQPWLIEPRDFFTETDVARNLFAQLINARQQDISIAPSVSYGMGIACRNLPSPESRPVLVLGEQFPSNVYPWLRYCKEHRCKLITVNPLKSQSWTDAVIDTLESIDVAVAALPHCHWTDGALLDLETIAMLCRHRGTQLVLDVTQSLGALALDIDKIKPAFLVCASYKWLLGPYSLSFVYAAPEFHHGEPLEDAWITRRNAHDFRNLVHYDTNLRDDASRFDVGETANFALMPMAIRALELILKWDPKRIQKTLAGYTLTIEQAARGLGLVASSIPARAGHFLGIRFPGGLPDHSLEHFSKRNIHISIRGDSIRVTPHLYNNDTDSIRFIEALTELASTD